MIRRARTFLVLLVILLVQVALLNELRVGGVAAEAILASAVIAGASYGANTGAKVGFVGGLLYDLVLLTSPLGLAAATYVLVGYGSGVVREGIADPSLWMRIFGMALASAFGIFVFACIGEIVGQGTFDAGRLPRLFITVGLMNSAIAPLLGAVLRFGLTGVGATEQTRASA